MKKGTDKGFLGRLISERGELLDRLCKLNHFIASDKFTELSNTEQAILKAQSAVMKDLHHVLYCRIAYADDDICGVYGVDFSIALKLLELGYCVARNSWGCDVVVFRQVPAHITEDIIPRMQSLPKSAKELILKGIHSIGYEAQCLKYNRASGIANSWSPSVEDIFANDWHLVIE